MKSSVRVTLLQLTCGVTFGLAIAVVSNRASAQTYNNTPITGVAVVETSGYRGELVLSDYATYEFLPRGFTSVGVLYPVAYASALCTGNMAPGQPTANYLTDAQNQITASNISGKGYNAAIDAMATQWYTNTVRFQISQGGLLYGVAHSDTTYTNMVRSVVAKARARGLVVILVLQTEQESCTPNDPNTGTYYKLPDGSGASSSWGNTELAWATLFNSTITNDPGVIIEPFNEPRTYVACGYPSTQKYNWQQWATGCNPNTDSTQGMVTVAQYIRNTLGDTTNVLLMDADNVAGGFLPDSSTGFAFNPASYSMPSNTAYTVHPFDYAPSATLTTDTTNWDSRWGNFESNPSGNPNPDNVKHAVIVGAWDISVNCPSTTDPNLTIADNLVQSYLPNHQVGLLGFAWDATVTEAGYLVNSYDYTGNTANYQAEDQNQSGCYATGATTPLKNQFQTEYNNSTPD